MEIDVNLVSSSQDVKMMKVARNSVSDSNANDRKSGCFSMNILVKSSNHLQTPQEFYFESRGKSCKKLLKFNGSSNKVYNNS